MKGPLKRRILYGAVIAELGETWNLPTIQGDVEDAGDVIALVWWFGRYAQSNERDKWWQTFDNVRENLALNVEPATGDQRVLSTPETTMLYEALTREVNAPDPRLLFDLYPLHPRVREISRKPFRDGSYIHAVLEAAKALEEKLREIALPQDKEHMGRQLAERLMAGKQPRIRFNNFQTKSERSEQEGLRLVTEGIFAAFRNPKGHEPMDASLLQMDGLAALDQLVTISLIFRRIDEAEIV
jgi:uncharacterized protein (TIGR02391 family)